MGGAEKRGDGILVDGLERGVELGDVVIVPGSFRIADALGENIPPGEGGKRGRFGRDGFGKGNKKGIGALLGVGRV